MKIRSSLYLDSNQIREPDSHQVIFPEERLSNKNIIIDFIDFGSVLVVQEYIYAFGRFLISCLLLKYSLTLFATYTLVCKIQADLRAFTTAYEKPLLSILSKNKISQPESIGISMQAVWLYSVIGSFPAMLFWYFSPHLFILAGFSTGMVTTLSAFVGPFALSLIPTAVFLFNLRLLCAHEDKKAIVFFNALWAVLNVLFAYLFIYGCLGQAMSGAAGFSLALLVAASLSVIAVTIYFMMSASYQKYHLFQFSLEKNIVEMKRLFNLSLGPLMNALIKSPVSVFIGVMLGWLGDVYIVLAGLATRLYSFVIPLCYAIRNTGSIRLSNQLGYHNFQKAKTYGNYTLAIVGSVTVFSIVLFAISSPLVFTLLLDPSVIESIGLGMAISVVTLALAVSALKSSKKTLYYLLNSHLDLFVPNLINVVIVTVFGLPLAYFTSIYFGMGITALLGSLLLAHGLVCAILTHRYYSISHAVSNKQQSWSEISQTRHSFWVKSRKSIGAKSEQAELSSSISAPEQLRAVVSMC